MKNRAQPSRRHVLNENEVMKLGPKMAFILRVYQMTPAEADDDAERDFALVATGKMRESIRSKRASTRSLVRLAAARSSQRVQLGEEDDDVLQ